MAAIIRESINDKSKDDLVKSTATDVVDGITIENNDGDKASNTCTFSNGKVLIVKNGSRGGDGDDGVRGSRWSTGTAITTDSTTGAVVSTSGITDALEGDMYINTSTYDVYKCTVGGNASTAQWALQCNIKGNGIASMKATDNSGSGVKNTITFTLDDGATETLAVYNGTDATLPNNYVTADYNSGSSTITLTINKLS